jgi:hypothetical protein
MPQAHSHKPNHRVRRDKSHFHATRHGILTRHPLEALARCGHNIRQIRRIEKLLRAELNPKGIVAEILFDRAWSSYLRCILIANAESSVFTANDPRVPGVELPRLREAEFPTLVFPEPGTQKFSFSVELAKHLAIVQRYDNHFSREFYRTVGLLLAMKNGSNAALTEILTKTLGTRKEIVED